MPAQSATRMICTAAVIIYKASTAFMTGLKPFSGQKIRTSPATVESTQQPKAAERTAAIFTPHFVSSKSAVDKTRGKSKAPAPSPQPPRLTAYKRHSRPHCFCPPASAAMPAPKRPGCTKGSVIVSAQRMPPSASSAAKASEPLSSCTAAAAPVRPQRRHPPPPALRPARHFCRCAGRRNPPCQPARFAGPAQS